MSSIEAILSKLIKDSENLRKDFEKLKSRVVVAPLTAGATVVEQIQAGVVGATKPHLSLLPETGTTDSLDFIENGQDGKIITLSAFRAGDEISVSQWQEVDNGNINLRAVQAHVLNSQGDSILLIFKASTGRWEEIGSDGGSGSATWDDITDKPAVFPPDLHAAEHLEAGDDPLTSTTPVADGVPQAFGNGLLDPGWINYLDFGQYIDSELSAKTLPVGADYIMIADSADSFRSAKVLLSNLDDAIAIPGTWSAVITGGTTNPTVTYTSNAGRYTRIGNVVVFSYLIIINTFSGGSGNLRVSLPLTVSGALAVNAYTNGVDLPGTPVGVVGEPVPTVSYMEFDALQDNAAPQKLTIAGVSAGDIIGGSGFYFV